MAFTLAQPAYGQAGSYTAQQDRTVVRANAVTQGVRNMPAAAVGVMQGDLAVTASATASRVAIAAGDVWIARTGNDGFYHAYNDAAITSNQFASLAVGNYRIDLVNLIVTDTGSATPSIAVSIQTGTNNSAAPTISLGANQYGFTLAQVRIDATSVAFTAGTTFVQNSWITDVRPKAQAFDLSVPTTGSVASATVGNIVHDGSVWNLKSYNSLALRGTSTSSLLVGTGSKTFTTQAGLGFVANQRVRAYSSANFAVQPTMTSVTSNTIGTGTKTFTVATGLTLAGARVRAYSAGTPTAYIEGTFTYTASTGSLAVVVDTQSGSGTYTDWAIYVITVYMEGVVSSYSTTSLVVTVDVTAGSGTFADWLIYGPAWEQPVKAAASGSFDGTYRFVPQIVAPSTATPLTPIEGNQWWQTDTNLLFIYDGTAWVQMAAPGAWTSWTPTYTGITQGTGAVNTGAYTRNGKLVQFYASLTLGTSPLYAAAIYINLPVGTTANRVHGQVIMTRSTSFYQWTLLAGAGVTTAQIVYPATGYATAATVGQLSGTFNVAGVATATASDKLEFTGWYVTT